MAANSIYDEIFEKRFSFSRSKLSTALILGALLCVLAMYSVYANVGHGFSKISCCLF